MIRMNNYVNLLIPGDSSYSDVNLRQPHDEQIYQSIFWHGHRSLPNCNACPCYIVSSNCPQLFDKHCLFSFIGISQELPQTAYIKMIDIWMIFTMMCPFSEILLLWLKDLSKINLAQTQGWHFIWKNTPFFCRYLWQIVFFCFVAVGPLANGKDNLMQEHRFINTSNITMTFHFRPFIPCRLWRWSNRILYSIEAAFIAIYWMAGLYVTYINPNHEQYKSC